MPRPQYDPISQEDYYKFFAFFNVSSDGGMQTRKGNAAPMLEIPDQEKQRLLPGVQSELTDAKLQLETLREKSKDDFHAWLKDREPTETDHLVGDAILNVPLWEGKDDKVADLLKPKRVGKIKGDAKWVKSRSDWGLKFNGKNFVDLGNVGDFERTDSFLTVAGSNPKRKTPAHCWLEWTTRPLIVATTYWWADNRISVHIINTWPTNAIKINTKKQLKAGEWKHVMVTYDGSSKASGVNVYVDGEKWDWTIEHDSLTETIKTKKALLIGSRTPGSRLKGEVDEVVMFDRCLEADEVAQIAKTSAADALANLPEADRTDAMNLALHDYYLRNHHDEFQSLTKKIDQLSKRERTERKTADDRDGDGGSSQATRYIHFGSWCLRFADGNESSARDAIGVATNARRRAAKPPGHGKVALSRRSSFDGSRCRQSILATVLWDGTGFDEPKTLVSKVVFLLIRNCSITWPSTFARTAGTSSE